jgi:hypothetical protein
VERQPTRPLSPRERRVDRARWWFQQMHQAVDRAMDWPPATPPRPAVPALALAEGRS